MTIKAIVFDLDDTLYEEKEYVKSGFKAVDHYIRSNYNVSGFYDIAALLFHSTDRKLIFNKTLEKLGISYDERTIKELVHCYRSHEPDIYLLNDARWVLNQLKDKVKIGILSDGYLLGQQKKITALNLKDKCDSVILSDSFGRENWKPSPFIYGEVSRQLMVPHHECMYVGDNLQKDFITANKLGWTTVQIIREHGIYANVCMDKKYEAQYQIDDLRKLTELHASKQLFIKEGELVHVIRA